MATLIESTKYSLKTNIRLETHPTKNLFEAHPTKGLFEAHPTKNLFEAHLKHTPLTANNLNWERPVSNQLDVLTLGDPFTVGEPNLPFHLETDIKIYE